MQLEYLATSETYYSVLYAAYAVSFFAFIGSLFIIAPYGKFGSESYGIELDPRLGWWLMEVMATVSFVTFYPRGPNAQNTVPMIFAGLYAIHYLNRGWFFPLSIRVSAGSAKAKFSWMVSASGIFVTSMHGYLNAMWYSKFCTYLDWDWFWSPTCLIGLLLYQISFWSTIRCEYIMRNLRDSDPKPGSPRYKIPRGFLFEYVTSPQYFTELCGFFGWAIMTWSPAGLYIFLISAANLIPRAIQTHKWYREKFGDDYPSKRRILIPFIW